MPWTTRMQEHLPPPPSSSEEGISGLTQQHLVPPHQLQAPPAQYATSLPSLLGLWSFVLCLCSEALSTVNWEPLA